MRASVKLVPPMAKKKPPRDKPNVSELLSRLAADEDAFLKRNFLAPALRGRTARVCIGGMVCKIRITPADFEGWGIFQPASHTEAKLVRQASLAERRRYLELFPTIRQIVCQRLTPMFHEA